MFSINNIYSTVQWFPWWIYVAMLVILSPVFRILNESVLWEKIIVLATILMGASMCFVHLRITFTEEDIKLRLFPFHFKNVRYSKNDIVQVKLVKYSPLKEFGGWGLRYNSKGEKAFTIWGNYALVVILNDKTRYIGIKDVKSTHQFLSKYYAEKYIIDSSIKELIEEKI